MHTVKVTWTTPEEFDVRLDGVAMKFKKGTATAEIDDKEHFISWSTWAKPKTPYAFEVSVNDQNIYKTPKDRKTGKKQVAFGALLASWFVTFEASFGNDWELTKAQNLCTPITGFEGQSAPLGKRRHATV